VTSLLYLLLSHCPVPVTGRRTHSPIHCRQCPRRLASRNRQRILFLRYLTRFRSAFPECGLRCSHLFTADPIPISLEACFRRYFLYMRTGEAAAGQMGEQKCILFSSFPDPYLLISPERQSAPFPDIPLSHCLSRCHCWNECCMRRMRVTMRQAMRAMSPAAS
jgi:hypothetical protein